MDEKDILAAARPPNGNPGMNGVISSRPKNDMGLFKETPTRWTLGDEFATRAKHHESIKALWEIKWKPIVSTVHCIRILVYSCISQYKSDNS